MTRGIADPQVTDQHLVNTLSTMAIRKQITKAEVQWIRENWLDIVATYFSKFLDYPYHASLDFEAMAVDALAGRDRALTIASGLITDLMAMDEED